MQTFLDQLEPIKNKLKQLCNQALKDGVIDQTQYNELLSHFEKEKIKIGVVGQIKSGKSTLLNALIFDAPVLPAAATPMTASLTYISYGEKPWAEVEFYSQDEWKRIEEDAKSELNSQQAKAAKELIDALKSNEEVEKQLKSLLGTTRKVSLDELPQYVGEDGKYVAVTKALKIYHPHSRLKEVDFVDTPGFNDPVISREKRASEFLEDADVVLFLIYAGRPFDATDKDLLVKRIAVAGTGKVLVVLNKMDTAMEEAGTLERAEKYVKEKFSEEVINLEKTQPILARVLKDSEVIPFSSLWALLGRMDKALLTSDDEDWKWYFEDHKRRFPFLKSQEDFLRYSRLNDIEAAIEKILKRGKLQIIVNKTVTALVGKYRERSLSLLSQLQGARVQKKALKRSYEDVKKEKEQLAKFEETMKKQISEEVLKTIAWLQDQRKELDSQIEDLIVKARKSAEITFPQKALFELHSDYSTICVHRANEILRDCKTYIEKALNEFNNRVGKKMGELAESVREKADESYAGLFTWDEYIRLRSELLRNFSRRVKISIQCDCEIKTSGWWFVGTSAAKDQALETFAKHLEQQKEQIDQQTEKEVVQHWLGTVAWLQENFSLRVVNPIAEALKEALMKYEEKEKALRELEAQEQNLEQQLDKVESMIKTIETQAEQLLVGA